MLFITFLQGQKKNWLYITEGSANNWWETCLLHALPLNMITERKLCTYQKNTQRMLPLRWYRIYIANTTPLGVDLIFNQLRALKPPVCLYHPTTVLQIVLQIIQTTICKTWHFACVTTCDIVIIQQELPIFILTLPLVCICVKIPKNLISTAETKAAVVRA